MCFIAKTPKNCHRDVDAKATFGLQSRAEFLEIEFVPFPTTKDGADGFIFVLCRTMWYVNVVLGLEEPEGMRYGVVMPRIVAEREEEGEAETERAETFYSNERVENLRWWRDSKLKKKGKSVAGTEAGASDDEEVKYLFNHRS